MASPLIPRTAAVNIGDKQSKPVKMKRTPTVTVVRPHKERLAINRPRRDTGIGPKAATYRRMQTIHEAVITVVQRVPTE